MRESKGSKKVYMTSVLTIGLLLTQLSLGVNAEVSIVEQNFDGLLTTSSQTPLTDSHGIHFERGTYQLYADGSNKQDTDYYLMVEPDVNNPDVQSVGVMIDKKLFDQGYSSKSLFYFKGLEIENGSTTDLYGKSLSSSSTFINQDEISRNAPYIEISKLPGMNSFHVLGFNGAMDGVPRKAEKLNGDEFPTINLWPVSGEFQSIATKSRKVFVNNRVLEFTDGNNSSPFKLMLTNFNGTSGGRIAGLSEFSKDTMRHQFITRGEYKKLAVFFKDEDNNDIFVIGTPDKSYPGYFFIELYKRVQNDD
jgi:hypothetical protein